MGGHGQGRGPEAGARPLSLLPPDPGSEGQSTDTRPDRRPPRYVRVVPDVPAIHRQFDYEVPEALDDLVSLGSRVRIALHGRRVGAWVVADDVVPPEGVTPVALARSSGLGPPPALLELAEWAAWRWCGPRSSFLGTASPLRNVTAGEVNALATRSPGSPPPSPGGGAVELVDQALRPGEGPALVRLPPALDAGRIVEEVLHRCGPEGVLVLVPSLLSAVSLAERLGRLGCPVAVGPDGWAAARAGRSVVIGARATAWAPLEAVRAVVVLDAHDEAYVEERAPTWSAVDVAIERARRDGAPCVLVSPCPPVTLVERCRTVTLDHATERRGWPATVVVDRRRDDPRTGLYSEVLVRTLREVLQNPQGRAICVLHRTGRVRLLACAECGTVAECTRCGGAVAQAEAAGALRCPRCRAERPPSCAVCDSARFKALRIGVDRASEELAALLGTPVAEVTATSSEPIEDARVIVGTEAALHRVRQADLVAFLDIDQHLLAHRFSAPEQTLSVLARAGKIVGGRSGSGRVIVQTRLADHEVLVAAVHGDPSGVTVFERQVRQTLGLPPFGALATLSGSGAPEFAAQLADRPGVRLSDLPDGRVLVRADRHGPLCDALASVPRGADRLRVAIDPLDV